MALAVKCSWENVGFHGSLDHEFTGLNTRQ